MLRAVLILLIAIANPVQAFAAAAMQSCGPGHERMHRAPAGTQERVLPERAHGHEASAELRAAPASVAHDAATIEAGVAGHPPLAEIGAHNCSACAACCPAIALPVGLPGIAEPPARFGLTTIPRSPPARFQTGGPDRPPTALAA